MYLYTHTQLLLSVTLEWLRTTSSFLLDDAVVDGKDNKLPKGMERPEWAKARWVLAQCGAKSKHLCGLTGSAVVRRQ